jgi:hypothetical protein
LSGNLGGRYIQSFAGRSREGESTRVLSPIGVCRVKEVHKSVTVILASKDETWGFRGRVAGSLAQSMAR